jgi:hypothetical protein
MLYGDLQILDYDLSDMNTLTLKIREDIEFLKGINVKLNPEKNSSLETELISYVWTLKKYFLTSIIFLDLHTSRTNHQEQIRF